MLLCKPWSASMLDFLQVRCSPARNGVASRRVGKLAGEGHGGEKNQGPTVGAGVDLQKWGRGDGRAGIGSDQAMTVLGLRQSATLTRLHELIVTNGAGGGVYPVLGNKPGNY